MPNLLLCIPSVQQKITAVAVNELREQLGVEVKIERLSVNFLNKIVLEDLYLEDRSGAPLFEAKRLSAGFNFFDLFRKRISFTTVQLFNFNIHLVKETPQSPLNLQFLIDAFAGKDSLQKPSPFSYRFNSILLRKGRVSYDVRSAPLLSGRINSRHLSFDNISSRISIKTLSKDSVNLQIRRMSLHEQSGLQLDRLSFSITGNKKEATLSGFQMLLPQSNIQVKHINLRYGEMEKPEDFAEKTEIEVVVMPSKITPSDWKVFYPALKNFKESFTLQANADGTLNNLNLAQCLISLSDKLHFEGKMTLSGLVKTTKPYLYGKVDYMYITTAGIQNVANSFSDTPVQLPPAVEQLGSIRFDGEISGYFDELVAFGKLSSRLGVVRTDLLFGNDPDRGVKSYFRGAIHTESFQLGKLLENSDLDNLSCDVDIDFIKKANLPIQSTVQANISELDFKKYKYKKLLLSGDFDGAEYTGKIEIDDPNAQVNADGVFHFQGDTSLFNFNASVQNVNFEALNITDKYLNPSFSFTMNADFKGTNLDELMGFIEVDSIRFITDESDFSVDKIKVESAVYRDDRKLQIESDVVNGELVGAYHFGGLVSGLKQLIYNYVPSMVGKKDEKQFRNNNFSFQLAIENTEAITNTLKLPFGIIEKSTITGYYNSLYDKIYLTADLPAFIAGGKIYEEGKITLENPQKSIDVDLFLSSYVPKRGLTHELHLGAKANGDSLVTCLDWNVNALSKYSANIVATTHFFNPGNNAPLKTRISIHPDEVTLRNNQWQITPTTILIDSGRVEVKGFSLSHEKQSLTVQGAISNEESDSLHLRLNNLHLENIFNIVGIPALTFGGVAVADLAASNAGGSFSVDGNLDVADFSFNGAKLGQLNMYSEWDQIAEGIRMMGTIYKSDSIYTDVSGHIFPIKNEISLYFNANDLDVSFIHPFVKKIANKLEGKASGLVHLFGDLDLPTIEGGVYVRDGSVGFGILNTDFAFNDSITMSPTTIEMHNLPLSDKYGHRGIVDGVIQHRGFKDFKFDVSINCNNLLVYDVPPDQNVLISGQIFGSGIARLKGGDDLPTDINVDMTTEHNTNIKLNFMENSEVSEYNFITYTKEKNLDFLIKKPVDTPRRQGPINRYLKKEKETDLNLLFHINATPDATVELLVDPQSGDAIVANGTGDIRIDFSNKRDFNIFGTYTAERGNYHFSLQQVIRRDFKIREGSTVIFNGDPFATTLNVDALYNLTANIQDLDQDLNQSRPNIPVNCVLNITGSLQSPAIGFNIELPNADEDLQRQVMGIINSEDMMSRQIIYLLVLNKFYTPDTKIANKSSDLGAVASATLSNQLSHLLGNMTDKVQIGTNIRTADGTFLDTEVDLLLSSQLLNNRLLVNGNFGYRDTKTLGNYSAFIGEFDLEYKLTSVGNFRLKAFNHYNDRYYYLMNAQNIQGVGVMFKKDFDTARELFTPVRRARKLSKE